MNVRYRITLTQYERNELGALLSGGKSPARKLKRAQILLAADAGVSDEDIALSVGVGGAPIYRTQQGVARGTPKHPPGERPGPAWGARPGRLVRGASSPERRKLCWWRPRARARRRAAPVGRWNCWRIS